MKFTKISDRGGRLTNEDYLSDAHINGMHCFVIADGLGGQSSGEIASKAAADAIIEAFIENPEISQDAVDSYLRCGQDAVLQKRMENPGNSDMATTAVVLITDGSSAVWGHIGDSRLYRFNRGRIMEITDDHSLAFQEFKNGSISYDGIRTSSNQNKLIHTIGDDICFKPDISRVTKIGPFCSFLLCTDGFWEYVNEDDMEKALITSFSSKQWLSKMLKILDRNKAPSNDNFTAFAIKMQPFDFI